MDRGGPKAKIEQMLRAPCAYWQYPLSTEQRAHSSPLFTVHLKRLETFAIITAAGQQLNSFFGNAINLNWK